MQIGIIGLGRMGANMARKLISADHECTVYDVKPQRAAKLVDDGAIATTSLKELVAKLSPSRAVWMMLPAAVVEDTIGTLVELLQPDDVLIDGGNSYYRDDIVRARELKPRGVHYIDVGISGGVWGLRRGFCQMIGGEPAIVRRLNPIFAALAPEIDSVPRTPGRDGHATTAEHGYLHCGPHGAGHFVKMIHNGIEYGMMAAYAEGFNILRHANIGLKAEAADAETAPVQEPEAYRYSFDVVEIAELWRRGSVIASWLLDLIAVALYEDPDLSAFRGHVSDSGEGRWTIEAAINAGVPAFALSAALYERFASRGESDFANKLLSAMRHEFGGHREK